MAERYRASALMLALFAVCLALHLWLGWHAFVADAAAHGEVATGQAYLVAWGRDVFENLQSEFLQLAAQMALVAGIFEAIHVRAYEQDAEEIKAALDGIAYHLSEKES